MLPGLFITDAKKIDCLSFLLADAFIYVLFLRTLQIPEADAAVLSLSINQDATYMAAINNQVEY